VVTVDMRGKTVLDVGCGDGWNFAYPEFSDARALSGVDIDSAAIARARADFPTATFAVAVAESLPFPAASHDVVIAKASLPYTEIRLALREMRRVLKPGGQLYLTMHDWRMQLGWFRGDIADHSLPRIIDHGYIVLASAIFALTGHVPTRPWNGTRQTFQTQQRLRRELQRAGFTEVNMQRTERHLIVTAICGMPH